MKIHRFRGQKIHGYMDLDVTFNSDLTFLTGINGSGKTTAINCVVSLIFPKLQYLCNLEFISMSLDIEYMGRLSSIFCSKKENGVIISCSENKSSVEFITFIYDDEVPPYVQDEDEYYNSQISRQRLNPVIDFILRLPKPMYLGLSRRLLLDEQLGSTRVRRARVRTSPVGLGVFSNTLETSFLEAVALAEDSASEAQFKLSSLDREFQAKLLTELIKIEPIELSEKFKMPTRDDLKRLHEAEKKIDKLPNLLGISEEELLKGLHHIIKYLLDKAAELANIRKESDLKSSSSRLKYGQIGLLWEFNKQNFHKIMKISEIVDNFVDKSDFIKSKNDKYIEIINNFLVSGRKSADFDDKGKIKFFARSGDNLQEITSLSSGEIQVFVIITHTFFNPNIQGGNVFIIDEPELSLHVNWQEIFVNSLLSASDEVQFILATHSPSIILDRVGNCVDLSVLK